GSRWSRAANTRSREVMGAPPRGIWSQPQDKGAAVARQSGGSFQAASTSGSVQREARSHHQSLHAVNPVHWTGDSLEYGTGGSEFTSKNKEPSKSETQGFERAM